jgi:hypothetical protein
MYYDTDDNDCYDNDYGYESDDYDIEDEFSDFADPGGNSALRAATPSNPRIYPCPTCEAPNRLTQKDVNLGYQCDACADRAERGGY